MKKALLIAASVLISAIAVLNVFSRQIKSVSSEIIFGEKTAVITENHAPENINLKKGDYICLGTFGGERILWKVLNIGDDSRPFLFSEKVLCFLPFSSGTEITHGSSSWETSDIKEWLNSESTDVFVFECTAHNDIRSNSVKISGGFLCQSNFTDKEKSLIDKNAGIFLPSTDDLSKLKSAERRRMPTAYAAENDNSRFVQLRKYCWYWTRTPISTNTSSVTAVTSSGGYYKTLANDALTGVCPCMYLTSYRISICAGDGSRENPFVAEGAII